jgi:hypothetical protein
VSGYMKGQKNITSEKRFWYMLYLPNEHGEQVIVFQINLKMTKIKIKSQLVQKLK